MSADLKPIELMFKVIQDDVSEIKSDVKDIYTKINKSEIRVDRNTYHRKAVTKWLWAFAFSILGLASWALKIFLIGG
jgi:hypothetical protein